MLATPAGLAVTHCEKEEALRRHFSEFLGAAPPRLAALNWEALGYAQRDLSHLEAPFSIEELKAAVFALPAEKTPGPDGLIGRFYRSCWEIISEDLFDAMVALAEQGGACFGLLNKANIDLLPKKAEAGSIADYRPIGLIHSFSKIFSKMLASRLAPILPALVSLSQSAFIKKRCIHDDFLHVQGLIREMFKEKTPGFFLKLDIAKAFDTVNWSYLLELLQAMGFGPRWRRWICIFLSTASSKILLNGNPGSQIPHASGLRQGDPLSPMLFVLAIDPLHHLFRLATEESILRQIRPRPVCFTVSLYADDADIFVTPDPQDMRVVRQILATFGDASGLRTNLAKSEAFPIQYTEEQISAALQIFPAKRGEFPCTYLGLPLHHSRLKAIHFQPLIDKLGARLTGWWGKHFTRAGRVLLCRSVLSAMVIYHLVVFKLPKWIIRQIEKIKRGFLWMNPRAVSGSRPHSRVNWSTVCRPKELGSLGVFDINEKFGRALRLRWPWYAWTDQARPWQGIALPCDATDMELFRASTDITIGDGAKCLFWHDRWMPGGALKLQFPELFAIASRKFRTALKELQDRNWLRSLFRLTTATELAQLVKLWASFLEVVLQPRADAISCRWTASGVYSTALAYRYQFAGAYPPFRTAKVWNSHAEPKCHFFAWLALHGKILTADNLAIRGVAT